MEKIYYSPKGFWRGNSATKKLSKEAEVSEKQALEFLKKQAIWQIYLPAPKKIIRPRFDVSAENEVHQADLLFLPYDTVKVGRINKTYKYALTLVDLGTRHKEAEPLTSKDSKEVAMAFEKMYKRHLKYPKLLQIDPGREFMGAVTQLMAKRNVRIRRGQPEIHRHQGVVIRFNRTLAERLFGYQYAKQLENPHKRNREWVKRLPEVLKALNADTRKPPPIVTRLSRKENPQKLTQLSSRSHPRHLVGKRTAQKDTIIDITSDSQVNSNFPNRLSSASLKFNNYFYLFLYLYIT